MNKTVLITGASRGIGKATALYFAEKGYNVVVNYNNSKDSASELVDSLENAICVKADVSVEAQVNEMFRKAYDTFGSIDVLVNNAAYSSIKPLQDISVEEWDKTFDINVKGIFLCSKCALEYMLRNKSGSIINISSMWGVIGASCEVHYSSSKAAVIGFTKALAKELAPSGINVNCVSPGCVDTDMNKHLSKEELSSLCEDIPLGRLANTKEIAQCIYNLSQLPYITGENININGGMVV